jgi:uncharacterized protein (TIGR02145 family)
MKNKYLFTLIAFLNISIGSVAQTLDTITDLRDSKTYKVVNIGTQTWMAENLAFKTSSGCWAYDNNQSNISTYGYLYNYKTAKKVCPKGWSLPKYKEWNTLITFLGGDKVAGEKLISTTGWENLKFTASNNSGFTALPGGIFDNSDKSFFGIGTNGGWWSSTLVQGSSVYGWTKRLFSSENFVGGLKSHISHGHSVRCIKNN